MKRIPIAELEGVALDWAVAEIAYPNDDVVTQKAYPLACDFAFSRDWQQCGPLIDFHSPLFNICKGQIRAEVQGGVGMGPTYKIAVCRAIVAAHNPDGFVEVPEDLL